LENLDTSSATGNFVLVIFAALAQLERDTIVERMKAGTEERRKIDGDIGGKVPTGYKRDHGTVIIDDEKADIVRYIYHRRYIDFRFISEIADELNDMGEDTRTKRGTKWDKSAIHGILKNEAKYLGGYRNKSKFRWPRILPENFEELEQKAIKSREDQDNLTLLNPSETGFSAKRFRERRSIKRPKQALAQLRALRNGEVIPDQAKVKKPKVYEEKVDVKIQPKTPSPTRKSSLKIRIPSPQRK